MAGWGVRFVSVCDMVVPFPFVAPETLFSGESDTLQLNVVPITCPDNEMDVVFSEQMVWLVGEAFTVGVGFTVIITVIASPVQPLATGTIVYVAVPGT